MSKEEKGIQYKMVPIKDTINQVPKTGFVPKVVRRGTIDTEQISKDISGGSSFTKGDILGVLTSVIEQIEIGLKSGYNVTINGLGTFSISAESRIVQSEDEIRGNSLQVKRITFKAAREFHEELKHASFQKIDKKKRG